MTINDYVEERNRIQIESGDSGATWAKLGVANRHIERVVRGALSLTPAVEKEIRDSLDSAKPPMTTDQAALERKLNY